MNRPDEILEYWFGRAEENIASATERNELWFGAKPEVDNEIRQKFGDDLEKAIRGEYSEWQNEPRSCLALLILLDQFSRNVYRDTLQAFAQDQKALELCLNSIQKEFDHALSLIERAFFYMPLMHAENLEMQATAVRAYQILVNLAFPETRKFFENFLDYAIKHYEVVERFGRFPLRNSILSRTSTPQEEEFLKTNVMKKD